MPSRVIIINHLPRMTAAVHSTLGAIVAKAALDMEGQAKALFSGSKTGRVYKRGKVSHQASAPGEAPATDTGAEANSIQADVSRARTDLYAEVNETSAQGAVLEFGGHHIAARPHMVPAAEAVGATVEKAAAVAVQRALAAEEVKGA